MESVAVFGQLDHILRERSLTIADLKHQIEKRYELTVDEAVLALLAGNQRLGQMDMTVVGAVASTLGVSLDDLLFVVVIPFSIQNPPTRVNTWTEEETWRVWALLGMQQKRKLGQAEQREFESIVDEGDRRADERFWHLEAQRRGVSFEDLREEIEEDQRIVQELKRRPWPGVASPRQEPPERAEAQRAPASR